MIKVEDLRVGNYLLDGYGEIFQVKQIGTGLIESHGMHIYEIEEIKPIELTEEILLKSEFLNWNGYYSKGDIKYEEENIILNFWSDDSYVIKGIKYLHQLQNLYFMLCNEELKINL